MTAPLKGAASSAAVAEPHERSLLAEKRTHPLKMLMARSAVVSSDDYQRSGVARTLPKLEKRCPMDRSVNEGELENSRGKENNNLATMSWSWMLLRKRERNLLDSIL